jgi:hypothetical protein
VPNNARLFRATGVMGGLTTYSAFSYETVRLGRFSYGPQGGSNSRTKVRHPAAGAERVVVRQIDGSRSPAIPRTDRVLPFGRSAGTIP